MALPDDISPWYQALLEEDCEKVLGLLKKHPRLLKEGWKSDSSRRVKWQPNFWMDETESSWTGRTALHVGARRGSVKLVEQVIKLCKGRRAVGHSEEDLSISSRQNKQPTTTFPDHSDDQNGGENWLGTSHSHANALVPSKEGDEQEVHKKGKSVASWSNSQGGMLISSEGSRSEIFGTAQVIEGSRGRSFEGIVDKGSPSLAFDNYKCKLTKVSNKAQKRAEVWVSLKDLLPLKDGQYNLDALAMAALPANRDILSLFIRKSKYGSPDDSDDSCFDLNVSDPSIQLRRITGGVIESLMADEASSSITCQSVLDTYWKHRDFNFLPRREYLFHFLFSDYFHTVANDETSTQAKLIREYLWEEVINCSSESLWSFLLKRQDGQGRPPLHVAVDEGTVGTFLVLLDEGPNHIKKEAHTCAMTAIDSAGRTALHRAVAKGNLDAIRAMRDSMSEADFRELLQLEWQHPLQFIKLDIEETTVDDLSMRNGFQGRRVWNRNQWDYEYLSLETSTPLHSAIIHKRTKLLDELPLEIFSPQHVLFPWVPGDYDVRLAFLDLLELATLVGEVSTVRRLVTETSHKGRDIRVGTEYGWLFGRNRSSLNHHLHQCPWPTIHIAANYGNYELLKAFIECPNGVCDPYIEDFEKNTVLHHAMKVREIKFEAHLLDYVDCLQIYSNDPRKANDTFILERRGCIELLLQSGCDIFKANQHGQLPYPRHDLSTNSSFLSWWYDKQSKEFKGIQNNMKLATNAISVTATLVATASYVGPLQPPLGYDGSPSTQIETNNIWVRIFIVCDTLSFYLAIASITFSLIPALPMPQEPMMDELKRIWGLITLAVATLFPSIICILVAFASSSIAVVIANGATTMGGNLTIITSSIGGIICLGGFFLLFTRLLGIIFPGKTWIRKVWRSFR